MPPVRGWVTARACLRSDSQLARSSCRATANEHKRWTHEGTPCGMGLGRVPAGRSVRGSTGCEDSASGWLKLVRTPATAGQHRYPPRQGGVPQDGRGMRDARERRPTSDGRQRKRSPTATCGGVEAKVADQLRFTDQSPRRPSGFWPRRRYRPATVGRRPRCFPLDDQHSSCRRCWYSGPDGRS